MDAWADREADRKRLEGKPIECADGQVYEGEPTEGTVETVDGWEVMLPGYLLQLQQDVPIMCDVYGCRSEPSSRYGHRVILGAGTFIDNVLCARHYAIAAMAAREGDG